MLTVPDHIYRAHIKRAQQSFERDLILPQFNSLPGRLVLSAKRSGPREWSLWHVEPGPLSFGFLGRLAGWWNPRLPDVPLDLGETRIDWHFPFCRSLTLRQAWLVTHHPHMPYIRPNLGPDLFCVASAVGPELRRVFYVTLDEVDGLGRGVDPNSIEPGKPPKMMTPKPDALIEWYKSNPTPFVPLRNIAQIQQDEMRQLNVRP